MKSLVIMLLLVLISAALCAQQPKELKLIALKDHGKDFAEFTYTDFGAIKEEKFEKHFLSYDYGDDKRLRSLTGYVDPSATSNFAEIAFSKKERKDWTAPLNTERGYQIEYQYVAAHGTVISKRTHEVTYVYDKNQRIKKIVSPNGKWRKTIIFEYDERGNVIKESHYQTLPSGKKEVGITHYRYDNMHNPYLNFHCSTEPGTYTNPNNIISITTNGHTRETTYQYNQQGYPIKTSDGIEFFYN